MDTLKILLGATMALLVGALAVSLKRMNVEVDHAPQEEVEELKRQMFQIREQRERLEIERERKLLREATEQPSASDVVTRQEVQEKAAEMQARIDLLEREAEEAKEDAMRAEAEAGLLTQRHAEDHDKTARRIRVINEAMQIATIIEWVQDPEFGGFAVLRIERPESVQPGSVLAIRRNGGILGKLRVGEITAEGAVGNPITAFGEVQPKPGDELILEEVVQLAN